MEREFFKVAYKLYKLDRPYGYKLDRDDNKFIIREETEGSSDVIYVETLGSCFRFDARDNFVTFDISVTNDTQMFEKKILVDEPYVEKGLNDLKNNYVYYAGFGIYEFIIGLVQSVFFRIGQVDLSGGRAFITSISGVDCEVIKRWLTVKFIYGGVSIRYSLVLLEYDEKYYDFEKEICRPLMDYIMADIKEQDPLIWSKYQTIFAKNKRVFPPDISIKAP